jgi:hypothetical protein
LNLAYAGKLRKLHKTKRHFSETMTADMKGVVVVF